MTDGRSADEGGRIRVVTERETRVTIGTGLHGRIWEMVRHRFPEARRCGLLVDERVAELWPIPDPADAALHVVRHALPAGESAKTRAVLTDLQDRLLELRRSEPVVVMGGGAALDVGGFAAATVRRGLPWVAVATTVVAMADAAIGGKVAVNHPRGKNLIGTFHPPALVLADVDYLETLEARDRIAGLAEIYKCARLGDGELLAALRRGAPADAAGWCDAVGRAVAVKGRLVERDERDQGPRRLLNYGHTLGHALERVLGNERMRHGEAVAIGMHAAARIAVARGLIPAAQCDEQARDLASLGLPTSVPDGIADGDLIEPLIDALIEALIEAMSLDKKRAPGTLHTWILPTGPLPTGPLPTGSIAAAVYEDVTDEEIRAVL